MFTGILRGSLQHTCSGTIFCCFLQRIGSSGWAGWALYNPEIGVSVNPFLTREADYAQCIIATRIWKPNAISASWYTWQIHEIWESLFRKDFITLISSVYQIAAVLQELRIFPRKLLGHQYVVFESEGNQILCIAIYWLKVNYLLSKTVW